MHFVGDDDRFYFESCFFLYFSTVTINSRLRELLIQISVPELLSNVTLIIVHGKHVFPVNIYSNARS